MPLHFNLALRFLICGAVAYGVQRAFPEVNAPGAFNVFQMSFLVTLCMAPLKWPNILLVENVTSRQKSLEERVKNDPVHQGISKASWPALERCRNGFELAEAVEATPIKDITICRFVGSYSTKKAKKLQEGLFKNLLPAIGISGGLLVGAIMIQRTSGTVITRDLVDIVTGITQAYVGAISFFWTVGLIYGEVELARDIARSA